MSDDYIYNATVKVINDDVFDVKNNKITLKLHTQIVKSARKI